MLHNKKNINVKACDIDYFIFIFFGHICTDVNNNYIIFYTLKCNH
jgi:hypothetical protein